MFIASRNLFKILGSIHNMTSKFFDQNSHTLACFIYFSQKFFCTEGHRNFCTVALLQKFLYLSVQKISVKSRWNKLKSKQIEINWIIQGDFSHRAMRWGAPTRYLYLICPACWVGRRGTRPQHTLTHLTAHMYKIIWSNTTTAGSWLTRAQQRAFQSLNWANHSAWLQSSCIKEP